MTDAEKREKVIAGLESCRPGRNCDGCPYHELFMRGRCNKQMEEDALVLLKKQDETIKHLRVLLNAAHAKNIMETPEGENDA